MCNFTPLVTRGDVIECVVCEGCGNGEDGAYESVHPDDMWEETSSYLNKKQRYQKISTSMRRINFDPSEGASREVGRRMQLGWQLSESPCPSCLMPLMSETPRSPEICVFCDPDDDIEIGDEDLHDDRSYSSRRSVTIELPDNFDPSDPNAMAQLASKAAAASSNRSVVSRARSQARSTRSRSRSVSRGPRERSYSQSRSMHESPMRPVSFGGPPKPMGKPMSGRIPTRPSPHPESRSSYSSARGGGDASRQRSRSRTPSRNPEAPMYIQAGNYRQDDDDASDISDNLSVAKSVASHTLDAIMSKINDCKATLVAPIDHSDARSVASKVEAAALMQKLSAAAAAVKALE